MAAKGLSVFPKQINYFIYSLSFRNTLLSL